MRPMGILEIISAWASGDTRLRIGVFVNPGAIFFGSQGDTRSQQKRLETQIKGFVHHEIDVRDRPGILDLIDSLRPDAIVHTAAQPSHDLAATIPFDDFDINASREAESFRSNSHSLPQKLRLCICLATKCMEMYLMKFR
ncbi:NAD-dependent epimerase/dehydratase family protein [Tolypothrix sp. VBCCA 56010]|uniref:NAD-dependent epimerase/dehydratase family protein n=1 Tax=Tolypothrix sp. VBCCA 56010 TaxID=3137731 RepID=UPI003D7C9909